MTRGIEGVARRSGTIAVVVVAALAACGDDEVDCASFRFDAQAWRAGDDRPTLAAGLHECKTLIGKERAEARRLLGPPLEGDRHSELQYVGPDALELDDEVLVVEFGANGRVIRTELVVP
jgi:hypothetical protein